jgi:ABC-type glycerol-3-phosphate transport system substrate-binding protein
LVILASLLGGALGNASPVFRAAAAGKIVLTVTVANPYLDPAVYLNAKTKATDIGSYKAAQMTRDVFNLFYKMHPDYVIKPLNWGWSDPLRQKILLNIAAGNTPDVIVGEDFFPEFARDGILEPINLGSLQNELAPGTLSVGMYQGKTYAVPAESGIFALFYNKTLFRKAGLDPANPPATWDQWLADAKKIQALGNGISGAPIEANTGLGAAFRVVPFMRQLGGDFMNKDSTQLTFNSAANAKALAFLRQLENTAVPGTASITDEGKYFAQWWSGKDGFVIDGPWEIGSSDQNKLDYGVAPLPLPAGGHAANVVVGNQMFAVPKMAKHKQAALDFVRLLGTQQAALLNYNATGRLPANLKVLDYVVANAAGGPMATFAEGIKVPGITGLPAYPANPQEVWNEWYKAQLAAIGTNQSIPQVLATAQSNAELLLQQ